METNTYLNLDWKEINYVDYCKLEGWEDTPSEVKEYEGKKAYYFDILGFKFVVSGYEIGLGQGGFVLRVFDDKYSQISENKILCIFRDVVFSNPINSGCWLRDFETVEEAKLYAEEKIMVIIEMAQGKYQSDLEEVLRGIKCLTLCE